MPLRKSPAPSVSAVMPGMGMGLSLWNTTKHKSTRSRGSISSISKTPTSPKDVPDGFGIPSPDDPDPFGVRALELAGLSIKEAGSHSRPTSDAFDYKPSPTSPAFRLSTQSLDAAALRDSRRDSKRDSKRSFTSTDHGTQTASLPTPPPIEERADLCRSPPPIEEEPSQLEPSEEEQLSKDAIQEVDGEDDEPIDKGDDDEEFDELEVDVQEIVVEQAMPSVQILTRAQSAPIETKARLVNISKRGPPALPSPPALPVKSPLRQRTFQTIQPIIESEFSAEDLEDDTSSTYSSSPAGGSFDNNEDLSNPWSAETSIQDSDSVRHKDDNLPDLDVPPLSDREDGSSLAESDTTHLDASQQTEPESKSMPYTLTDLNTSGETLAVSIEASEDHKQRGSVDVTANTSEQSFTRLVGEAPALDSKEALDDDVESVSSFYEEEPIDVTSPDNLQKQEVFHSASSLPQEVPTMDAHNDEHAITA